MSVQPRKDGSWWLGFLPECADEYGGGWEVVAWGDGGWHSKNGEPVSPSLFADMPEPKPKPTEWMPPTGRIRIFALTGQWRNEKGELVDLPFRWGVDVERDDGTPDPHRDWSPWVSREEATDHAERWSETLGLPVAFIDPPTNIVSFPRRQS